MGSDDSRRNARLALESDTRERGAFLCACSQMAQAPGTDLPEVPRPEPGTGDKQDVRLWGDGGISLSESSRCDWGDRQGEG